MNPQEEKEFIDATHTIMSDRTPLAIEIDIQSAWLLISAIQLTVRHPQLHAPMRDALTGIASKFSQAITALHPEAEQLIAAGWDPQYDV